jgi:dTDP-4-dehydrorhamnose reductase
MKCLIGHSGFVGSTLLKQSSFEALYRSTDIQEIRGKSFDSVVCAGAPAQKWIANSQPQADLDKIDGLIDHLKQVECRQFVLISTVDVFKQPIEVYESSLVEEEGLHPYGLHRRKLEKFVASHFPSHLIVRLPGLVGPGLRKNIIFDFLNNNNLSSVESRAIFQFYPMVNLWFDIETALKAELNLVHLTAEPISVREVALAGFAKDFAQELANKPALYDLRSEHAKLFSALSNYQYSKRETVQAIRSYAQSEPLTLKK